MSFPHKSGANYEDSIVALVLLPLIWIFISIRIYVRGYVIKQPGWDDFAAVVAACLYTLQCVTVMLTNDTTASLGHLSGPPAEEKLVHAFKLYLTTVSAYISCCFFVKLTLGLGYLRILKFRHLDVRRERLVCYGIIMLSCTVNAEHFIFSLFSCASQGFMPLDTARALATGDCSLAYRGIIISAYVQSTTNVIVDWVLVFLPVPSILGAIMDGKTRLSIIVILCLGVGGSIASIIRLVVLHTFFDKNPKTGTLGSIVSHVEIGSFIIFACLSTFHPLLAKYSSSGPQDFSDSSSYAQKESDKVKLSIVKQDSSPPRPPGETTK